jgi:hypothetical protein
MEKKITEYKVPRTEAFCSYRSYRFNELVHAHYFRENGVYPPFALLREYFKKATETTIRHLCRNTAPSRAI